MHSGAHEAAREKGRVRIAAALLLALAACATSRNSSTVAPPDEVASAAASVWRYYGAPGPLPTVRAARPEALTCSDGNGWILRSPSCGSAGECCVAGSRVGDYVVIALPPGKRLSDTALAHELLHVALDRMRQPVDPLHQGEPWRPAQWCAESATTALCGWEARARALLESGGR